MNEYVNIKRQSVSHPPISVQTRALRFSLGEKIISGSRAAIFSPYVEQRAPRFTVLGPINDRLQTIRGILATRKVREFYYSSFHTSNHLSVTGKFPWTWDLLHKEPWDLYFMLKTMELSSLHNTDS